MQQIPAMAMHVLKLSGLHGSLQVFQLLVAEQALQECKDVVAQQAQHVSELKAELTAHQEADQVCVVIIITIIDLASSSGLLSPCHTGKDMYLHMWSHVLHGMC